VIAALLVASLAWLAPAHRTFGSPEEAVRALASAVEREDLEELRAIFGPDADALVDRSDPDTARRNRQVFIAAMAEGWRIEDAAGGRKVLVAGNEDWPFPVPLARQGTGWRFDTAAGREEVLARRIGRNELAAIAVVRSYVAGQRRYAAGGHDGKPPGTYATRIRGGPLHGYFFRILTAQGAAAPGGPMTYVANGELTGGFALVAWPSAYGATGIMAFIVNHDGIVYEKDLGPGTDTIAAALTAYDPDASWERVP
jgi:hypothetical protein